MNDLGIEGALNGYQVVDFSQGIAGPYCAAMLGGLGARVVKVERMFSALFAADGVYRNTPFAVQRGHDQLREYWQRVKLQEDVRLEYQVLAAAPGSGIAHWRVTYQVASEALFEIWARSTGTNLVARKPGDPLPRMTLDGVLHARLEGDTCVECRLWWHSMPTPP